ncbi:MAG: hypothetical protein AAFQ98_19070 [Bacteroidota bacterium]
MKKNQFQKFAQQDIMKISGKEKRAITGGTEELFGAYHFLLETGG